MSKNEDLTDDYVAHLLAKDAKESSIKYSSMGLEAFTQSNKGTRGIESTSSRSSSAGNREEKASRVGTGDIRKRQLGDIAAILGGGSNKRRKAEGSRNGIKEPKRVNKSAEDEILETKGSGDKKRKRKSQDEDEDDLEKPRSRKSHRRHRSVSPDGGRDDDGRKRRRSRSRSRSPGEHRSKESRRRHRSLRERSTSSEPAKERRKEKARKSHRKRPSPSPDPPRSSKKEKLAKKPKPKPDSDSDPLDDIIGPRPTTVQEFDPDEENDWDQALEALRDRQKWQRLGAERLKAAGFTEEELTKWKKGGEKQEEDVKWAKAGEGREWDRGKVVHDDGRVPLEPSWGRSKHD
ncbi:hypothetical protein B7494_g5517 [Chlorociboria aeruginascens]|nr:hypothetical protein B7494_g5517 [Chlorociboria aeruginascens]